jgi:hypothetical protein
MVKSMGGRLPRSTTAAFAGKMKLRDKGRSFTKGCVEVLSGVN